MVASDRKLIQFALGSNAFYVFLLFLFEPDGINVKKLVISSFLAISVAILLYVSLRHTNSLNSISKSSRNIFYMLMFWSLIVVVRSFSFSVQDWATNFGNVYMALAWFTPLLIVVGQKIENWNAVLKVIFFMFQLMLVAFLILPFVRGSGKLKTEWTWLIRPFNFIILLGLNNFKPDKRLFIYIIGIIYLIIAIETKQRIEFVYFALVIFFLTVIFLRHIRLKLNILRLTIFVVLVVFILIFTYGYENLSLIVTNIIEFDDSRTFLFNELLTELNSTEKVVGRGSLGKYYSHFFEITNRYYEQQGRVGWKGDDPHRITIEVGYLQMILKGGFTLFLLTFFLMLKGAYLGIFKSNNKFSKRLGLYIFIISILSMISFRPAFTPTFIILWIAIGTVLNKENRELNDTEIKEAINFSW